MKKPLPWVPLWVDGWLLGSTRFELTPEQRSVFIDFLVLAAKDDGIIRAAKNYPYPVETLANMFRVPVELVVATINRCIEVEKLRRLPDGSLYVSNWEEHKLSPRWRRQLQPPPPGPPLEEEKNESRVEESKDLPKRGTHFPKRGIQTAPTEEKDDLPDIPIGLGFDVIHKLEDIRASYRRAKREGRKGHWDNPKSLKEKFLEVLEDFAHGGKEDK